MFSPAGSTAPLPRRARAAMPKTPIQSNEVVTTIGGVRVRRRSGERAVFFVGGLAVDADGAPRAYHPDGSPPGLDLLENAGSDGNWFGVVTNGDGRPVVQRAGDPAPGFF